MPQKHSPEELVKLLDRTVETYHSREELIDRLRTGKKLRIKYGVDATAPFLHIGHAVNLWLMRTMQEQGHKVVFLLGDFTTRIGDPTGKSQTRPVLGREEIEANAKAFLEQVSAVLHTDDDVFEVRRNSEWFDAMGVAEFLTHVSAVTHAQLISRDMFQARITRSEAIHMHEMLYPILQGYDSLMLDSDLTIVGTDQLFNELMGRFYQQRANRLPQIVITTKITPGTDGKEKQSKSLGNYIALADSPRDKFGKTLSIPDTLTEQYFVIYTDVPLPEVDNLMARHPRDAKLALATNIVARYHGMDVAVAEREWFERTFSQRQIPKDIPELEVPAEHSMYEIVKLAAPQESGKKIREYFSDGAIKLDGTKVTDLNSHPDWQTATLTIGRRRWFRIVRKDT